MWFYIMKEPNLEVFVCLKFSMMINVLGYYTFINNVVGCGSDIIE